jgi:hypothetical protein
VAELDETVLLTLISAPGARIAPNTLTILDNDPNSLPVVSIASTNQPYAVEGGGSGAFVFTRTGPTTNASALSYLLTGTAGNGVDYATLTNTVTIPIGQSSVTLPVVPLEDALIEGEETVIAALTCAIPLRLTSARRRRSSSRQRASGRQRFDASEPDSTSAVHVHAVRLTNTPLQVFFAISGTASNGGLHRARIVRHSCRQPVRTLPVVPDR